MGRDKKPEVKYEAHIRVTLALLDSPAYIALDWSARSLFTDMRSKLRGSNNGNINAALTELRHRGWRSPVTLAKALRQLEAVGLIAKTRQTIGVMRGSKVCNLYRFTDLDTLEFSKFHIAATKATHDYKRFTALTDARRAIAAASPAKKKATLQKLYRDATETVSIAPVDATETVVTPMPSSTENVASRIPRMARKANSHAGLVAALAP
jgi:hypothetical protein